MPGVCGPEGLTGLLVPSFDRVGRRFPLTVAVALPTVTALAGLPAALRMDRARGKNGVTCRLRLSPSWPWT